MHYQLPKNSMFQQQPVKNIEEGGRARCQKFRVNMLQKFQKYKISPAKKMWYGQHGFDYPLSFVLVFFSLQKYHVRSIRQ